MTFVNHFCFDYRSNPESLTILFWDSEEENMKEAIYSVCSSLTELFGTLRNFEDED